MAISVPTVKPVDFSETLTFFEGDWHAGNVPIMGPRTHGAWLASTVFDGARAFEGVAPDLDRHCERVNRSAVNFKLKPVVDTETWLALAREGIARFGAKAELYIRPMYWAQTGSGGGVLFDPETTNWCLCIYAAPMPPITGSAITLSPFRRPTMESAPVDCKAGCLYPNNSRALIEAQARGFNNCLMLDMLGNVAEFGNSNVFMAKHGVVYTPAPNGTFLNGITRQRVIGLLARRWRHGHRDDAQVSGFSRRRRNLFQRQFRQGRAGDPDRRPLIAAGPGVSARAKAVLGFCA